jgi:UDP-sulfoquinovose synthase
VKEIADIIANQYNTKIDLVENPRKELAKNELEVSNKGLKSLGFNPILLSNSLLNDIKLLANLTHNNFNKKNVLSSPRW